MNDQPRKKLIHFRCKKMQYVQIIIIICKCAELLCAHFFPRSVVRKKIRNIGYGETKHLNPRLDGKNLSMSGD